MSPVPTILWPEVKEIAGGDLWQSGITDTKVPGEQFVENFMMEKWGQHYVNLMTSLGSTQSEAARIKNHMTV